MIESWRDDWLRGFFLKDVHAKKLPSEIRDRVFRKLQMIDDSASDADLRIPPSNHFERLSGALEGWGSIRVNLRGDRHSNGTAAKPLPFIWTTIPTGEGNRNAAHKT